MGEQRMEQCNASQLVDERLSEVKSFVNQYLCDLEKQLGTLRSCAGAEEKSERSSQGTSGDTGSMVWHVQESSLKDLVQRICERLIEERIHRVQADSEAKCKALQAELGDLKLQGRHSVILPALERQAAANMQTALEERCCILEARLNAQIEQFKCSEEHSGSIVEGFMKQAAGLEEKVEKHYATLDARIGSGCVSEQVNGAHRRISTVQAMMERRCSTMESQVCALHKHISDGRYLREGQEPMPQEQA